MLAACGGDDDDTPTGEFSFEVEEGTAPLSIVAAFPGGFEPEPAAFVAGIPQRLPFVLVDAEGPVREDAPDSVEVEVRFNAAVIETFTLTKGGVRLATPFYALTTTFAEAGPYEVNLVGVEQRAAFRIAERAEVPLVQVGDQIRPVTTPTLDDSRDVDPICTRVPEFCPWHDEPFDAVLARGQAAALMISTPAFCQSDVCGPVLELLTEKSEEFPEIAIVHAEVYVYPAELGRVAEPELTEAVDTYSLTYEPSLIVANAAGIVTARLDFAFDELEIAAALATATA